MNASIKRLEGCYRAVKKWADTLLQGGWLTADDVCSIDRLETAQADALFDTRQRPLLVAFFGGTGAGKSSLLNRLAGHTIAEVGVVRPTSHRVTLYLHQDYRDSLHERSLPTADTRVTYHADDSNRYFAWLDLPDIDSTEQTNRAIVEQWLPVIDWLVYVVTPDRYQDDLGWRFVQARGNKHAWLFVMNHWDEGRPEQHDDFRQRLIQQGFDHPLVLRTSCTEQIEEDDFTVLEETLHSALEHHGLENLRLLSTRRQWSALDQLIAQLYQRVQNNDAWQAMASDWRLICRQGISELDAMLSQNAGLIYPRWLARESTQPEAVPELDSDPQHTVYDVRCHNRLETLRLTLENRVTRHRLPLPPAQEQLNEWIAQAEAGLRNSIRNEMSRALQKPGNLITRTLSRLFAFLQWALPLAAAGWAGYHVIQRFVEGTVRGGAFLGLDFAIHSLLLIALAWFVPWMARRQLRPSLAKAALTGVKRGITAGTEQLCDLSETYWTEIELRKQAHLGQLQTIREDYAAELAQTGSVLDGFSTTD